MKPNFYMLVGLPGSGKSKIAEELNGIVFSSDSLRKELWGSEEIQGDNQELFSILHQRISRHVRMGKKCMYDATNIKAKRRKAFLKEIEKIDCKKICIFVATDINVCLNRNDERDKKVPYEVIKRMYLSFDVPQYREGWDEIVIQRTLDENNDYNIFKFIDYLESVEHDNPHHMLTIGSHIQAVVKHIIDKYKLTFAGDIHRLERLITAALYHDIGKNTTKVYIDKDGNKTEEAHYYNHENVSAYMYMMYEKEEKIQNNLEDVLYVADLVGLHMRLFDNKGATKLKTIVSEREYEDLCILHEADIICA